MSFILIINCFNSLIAISKLTSYAKFKAIYLHTQPIKALDFGCGIGRQTLLLSEFGIESHGIDISDSAIQQAQLITGTCVKCRISSLRQRGFAFW